MIAKSLAMFLRANPAISEACKSISPLLLEADAQYPAMVYSLRSIDPIPLLDGGTSTLAKATADLNILSESYSDSHDIADVVTGELHNYVGAFGDHYAEQIKQTADVELFESEVNLFRATRTFEIWYTKPEV